MRRELTLHPDSQCSAVTRIDVEVARPRPGELMLRYAAIGDIVNLRLPPATAPARTDNLWQSTCFEAFIRASSEAGYYEFNFSPSTQWAAYRFDGYRSGMRPAGEIGAPRIEVQSNDGGFELRVELDLAGLSDLPLDEPWQLGLSAVIEETNGRKSWWALAHPPGKPDFHHSDCFALEVPTALAP